MRGRDGRADRESGGGDIPTRREAGYEAMDQPRIFARQGSAVAREPRTRWASPFTVGRDGNFRACRQKYARALFNDAALLTSVTERTVCEVVCECPIGFPCHVDVLAWLGKASSVKALVELR